MEEAFEEKLDCLRTESEVEVTLETLSLEEAEAVAEAIQGNPSLKTLDLTDSGIGSLDHKGGGGLQVEALAAGLRGTSVTSLELLNTGLGDEGVEALAAVLGATSIRSLKMDMNGVTAIGAQALADALRSSSVTELSLGYNKLRAEGVRILAPALGASSLRTLALHHNDIGVDGISALAEGLKSSRVTSLGLRDFTLGEEGVKVLASALPETGLQSLSLGLSRIALGEVRALAAVLRDSSVSCLVLVGFDVGYNIDEQSAEALLEGLADSPVVALKIPDDRLSKELRSKINAVLEANKERSLVLQMTVQKAEHDVLLTFRTIAGSEAAVLSWSLDRPVQDLPKAVLMAMQSSGFQHPKGLGVMNLKLVRPDGAILDVGSEVASLAQQLGIDREPHDLPGTARAEEAAAQKAASQALPRA